MLSGYTSAATTFSRLFFGLEVGLVVSFVVNGYRRGLLIVLVGVAVLSIVRCRITFMRRGVTISTLA